MGYHDPNCTKVFLGLGVEESLLGGQFEGVHLLNPAVAAGADRRTRPANSMRQALEIWSCSKKTPFLSRNDHIIVYSSTCISYLNLDKPI